MNGGPELFLKRSGETRGEGGIRPRELSAKREADRLELARNENSRVSGS